MKITIFILSGILILHGCTYNISLADTHGSASDVIDDTQSPTNSADIKIPLVGK